MRNLKKLVFAAALTFAASLSTPPQASAVDWCLLCDQTDDCVYCCICGGGAPAACTRGCG